MVFFLHLILTDLLIIAQILLFYCHFWILRIILEFEFFRDFFIFLLKVINVIMIKWSLYIFNRFWLTFSHIFLLTFLPLAHPVEILDLSHESFHKISGLKYFFFSEMNLYMNEWFFKIYMKRWIPLARDQALYFPTMIFLCALFSATARILFSVFDWNAFMFLNNDTCLLKATWLFTLLNALRRVL